VEDKKFIAFYGTQRSVTKLLPLPGMDAIHPVCSLVTVRLIKQCLRTVIADAAFKEVCFISVKIWVACDEISQEIKDHKQKIRN
jgi:hypothetical protein